MIEISTIIIIITRTKSFDKNSVLDLRMHETGIKSTETRWADEELMDRR